MPQAYSEIENAAMSSSPIAPSPIISRGENRLIKVFTPSFADVADTNAQNLTAKEVVARLDPERFHVTLFYDRQPDPRIAARPNTRLWKWQSRGNTARTLLRISADTPDIYFFPREGPLDTNFFRARQWMRWHSSVVTYMVSGGLDRMPLRSGQLLNLRYANLIFGNCEYLTALLQSRLGVQAQTIHDGIDTRYYFAEIERSARQKDFLTVLFAGSFRKYKRAHVVIEQAARLPQVQFRLAGQGEELDACRRLASELGCANVIFLGHLDQADLGREMRDADIFLLPSELEGHPQVLLQAAACGLPAVAMNSYRPDAVVDGQTGFLVNDDRELTERIQSLINIPELRKKMSIAAVRHAAKFTWERAAEKWAEAFERLSVRSNA